MALKTYVISHTATGTVLAACTRGQGSNDNNATILAQLIGVALPVVIDPVVPPADRTAFAIDPSQLSLDATPSDPFSLDPSGPLFSPLTYTVTRDTQGNFQALNTGGTVKLDISNTSTSQLGLAFTSVSLPTPTVPNHSVPGWVMLIDSSDTVTTKSIQVSATSTTDLTHGTAPMTVAAGTYSLLILVQGCAAYTTTHNFS